jgi:Fic family protein
MEAESATNALIERMDRIVAILKLAHAESLARTRERLHADTAKKAILEVVGEDWQGTKSVQERAAKTAGASERTIREHLGELVALGVLDRRGEARNTEYRSSGIVG